MQHHPTFDLSKLLINDMLKIEKNSHPFDLPELNNMMKNAKEIGFKQKVTKGNATFEFRRIRSRDWWKYSVS